MPLLCPQSKQLIVLRLYRIMRIVDCHVPIILSVHIPLGACYEPADLDVPITHHGFSYGPYLLNRINYAFASPYISIRRTYRPVHSQVRQLLTFSPWVFYRPPACRQHHPPLDSFRYVVTTAVLRLLSADFTELLTH